MFMLPFKINYAYNGTTYCTEAFKLPRVKDCSVQYHFIDLPPELDAGEFFRFIHNLRTDEFDNPDANDYKLREILLDSIKEACKNENIPLYY